MIDCDVEIAKFEKALGRAITGAEREALLAWMKAAIAASEQMK